MIFLYIVESVAPSGKLIRKFTCDPLKAAMLQGRITARKVIKNMGMHHGRHSRTRVH